MIKTLRITSVIAVILAGVFLVFPVVYGVRRDQRVEKIMNSPDTAEQFKNTKGNNTKGAQSRTSPLVQQAEAFAAFLNPKQTVVKSSPTSKSPLISRSLPATTPKFDVFATSYCPENPELSLALIDEPGRGRRWVRQSSMIGHVLIEEVKDGLIIAKSGDKTFEVPIRKANITDTEKGKMPVSTASISQNRIKAALPTIKRPSPTVTRTPSLRQPIQSDEEDSRAGELISRLEDLQKTTAVSGGQDRAARIAELIAKVKATRTGDEDDQKQTTPEEELQDSSLDPNQSLSVLTDTKAVEDSDTNEPSEEK